MEGAGVCKFLDFIYVGGKVVEGAYGGMIMAPLRFGPIVTGVVEKVGCQVPQTFAHGFETKAAVLAVDAGLCRFVSPSEGVHRLVGTDGALGAAVILTDDGRDELVTVLNTRREGFRQPPYPSTPLSYSRFRKD